MNKTIHTLLFSLLFISTQFLFGQTTWTGATTTFTKTNNANPTLESNQDRITTNVWLTRGNGGGQIYNAKSESNSSKPSSPADTQWALGTTANLATLSFDTFRNTISPKNVVGKDMVLHLVTDNIYIDIKFTSWTSGKTAGGGFSYERSTNQNLSILDVDSNPKINIYPNPASDFIALNNLKTPEDYHIYTVLGTKVMSGVIAEGQKIDVSSLNSGVYFIDTDSITLPFIKE